MWACHLSLKGDPACGQFCNKVRGLHVNDLAKIWKPEEPKFTLTIKEATEGVCPDYFSYVSVMMLQ
jgi:hypothetical protein